MGKIIENAVWQNDVYLIEKSDKVLGGEDGKINLQAKNLADRTAYLKAQVETKANKNDVTTGLNGKANATHTHTMANITDLATAMNAKANLASPTFTGSPKAPTPAQTVNDTTIATTAFVKSAIATLVGSAPATLDTLAEIATALGSDGNLKNTLLTEIGKKANQTDFTTLKNLLIGIPFPYPLAAVPSGCLAFNGQAFNKSTYPILAQKYPSGVLPDLRGEFIRGWDSGRGADSGRTLLSAQGATSVNIARSKLGYRGTTWSDNTQPDNHDGNYESLVDDLVKNGGLLTFAADKTQVMVERFKVRPRNVAFQYICLAA